ncbi:MAG: endonuclease/exonuclease/phosphatase family protein, partial [Bacillota bacterium]
MACRMRLAGLVVVMLLVGCARQGGGGRSGASRSSEPGVKGDGKEALGSRVRVMTYNVNWGTPGMEKTVGTILESGADVVCLQEITEVWERRLREQLGRDYPHMRFRLHLFPSGGMAVLSRWPVEESAYVQPLGGWFPAWVLRAQTPVGQMQGVVVHLYPPVQTREGARH